MGCWNGERDKLIVEYPSLLRTGLPVFINRGSSEMPHLGKPPRVKIEAKKYAGMVELVDSGDLGAVTSVKVFPAPLSLRTSPQTGVTILSLKTGLPVFIKCGSSEKLHFGYLPV